jgi:hypothetical protein
MPSQVSPATWDFVVCNAAGTPLGPLEEARERKMFVGINAIDSFSFRLNLSDSTADQVLGMDTCIIKGYHHDEAGGSPILRFCGPLTTAQEAGSGQGEAQIQCVARSGLWRFTKRLIGKSQLGWTQGTALVQQDLGYIIRDMLYYANGAAFTGVDGATGPHTGVDTGVYTVSSNGYVGPWHYKQAWEAMTDVAGTLGGPDLAYVPREPTLESGTVKIGYLDIDGSLGQDRSGEIIFDYGTGRNNVSSYSRQYDAEGNANRVFSVGPPNDTTVSTVYAQDSTSITARGLYEDRVETDLAVDFMRLQLCGEHVAVRAYPRQIISFVPSPDQAVGLVPVLWRDFVLGDNVRFRAEVAGATRINAIFRVYGANFDITDDGVSQPSYVLVPT